MKHQAPFLAWRRAPLSKIVLWLIAGISLAIWLPTANQQSFLPGLFLLLLVSTYGLLRFHRYPRRRWLSGLLLGLCVAGFGYWRTLDTYELNRRDHFSYHLPTGHSPTFIGVVADRRQSGEQLRLTLNVQALADTSGDRFRPRSGRLLLYVPADSATAALVAGDRLLFRGEAGRIAPPANPLAFDWAAYQAARNVHYQAYVDAEDWRLLPPSWSIRRSAMQLRRQFLAILKTHLPDANSFGVAAALILGDRDGLDPDLRDAYAETGAIHVLAVSGLHVGFIAFGLQWLLYRLFGRSRRRWLVTGLTIAGVWSFALITGLSPSVMRAAVMFSFVLIGRATRRRMSIYNSLAASAFLLLCLQPRLLFDVGFQLSYLAVLGIAFFQPRLSRLLTFDQAWLHRAWQLTAVGLAAQLTTFPLGLYYFHQFPIYFWLSSPVVVLLAPVILGLGVSLFAVAPIPILATAVGTILNALIVVNNAFIQVVRSLPGALIQNIWLSGPMLVALLAGILALATFWYSRRVVWLVVLLLAMIGIEIMVKQRHYRQAGDRELVIYHLPRATLVDWFDGRRRYSWQSADVAPQAVERAGRNYRSFRRALSAEREVSDFTGRVTADNWFIDGPFIGFHQHRAVIVDPDFAWPSDTSKRVAVDLALVTGSPRLDLDRLRRHLQPKLIVFDGSNYPGQVDRWMAACRERGQACYATARQGAYRLAME